MDVYFNYMIYNNGNAEDTFRQTEAVIKKIEEDRFGTNKEKNISVGITGTFKPRIFDRVDFIENKVLPAIDECKE